MSCVCCLTDTHRFLFRAKDMWRGGASWAFVSCCKCQHRYIFPGPTRGELTDLYTALYENGGLEVMKKLGDGEKSLRAERLDFIQKHHDEWGAVVDVGLSVPCVE